MAISEASEELPERRAVTRKRQSRIWPLAPSVYLVRNSARTIPLIAVILLAVLLVSGVITLIDSIPYSIRIVYAYSQQMLGVSPRGDPNETPKLLDEIRRDSPVPLDRIMSCRVTGSQVQSIVGSWPFVVVGLTQSDMRYYLKRLGATHIEGRLPNPGAPEAIVSRPVARNLKLRIYDPKAPQKIRAESVLLGPDKTNSYSPQFVKIVGIADTDNWLMVNSIEYQRAYHFPPIDLGLVFAKNLKDQGKLAEWAEKHFEGRHAEVFAYDLIEKQTQTMFKTLYTILNFVVTTLALVITLMMGMLMNIYQSQRLVEFGLLQAIGYTRRSLLIRAFLESTIVIVIGWLLGVGGALAMLRITDHILMAPHAYALEPFDATAFKYTVPLPIAILAVAGFTVWWRFRRFDPVGVVERRLV